MALKMYFKQGYKKYDCYKKFKEFKNSTMYYLLLYIPIYSPDHAILTVFTIFIVFIFNTVSRHSFQNFGEHEILIILFFLEL